jgi:hypothetical protein
MLIFLNQWHLQPENNNKNWVPSPSDSTITNDKISLQESYQSSLLKIEKYENFSNYKQTIL